ncbi:TRAP transporter substrate-binding protein [Puniceibacterium confluentis]|uniref:TRAP transporter substrate-binding protein n=1 Tax=Puniceibacterium confluentis TaxID=1958944 RepID=UPI0011B3DB26|nr:TRAP transporter substrate-binding protein DctP [Puniceibacterium confluentis]
MSAPLRLTLGGYQGPGSVHTRALFLLRDAILRRLGDRVTVTVRANLGEDGHKTADLPTLTERGEIDGCYISSSYLAERVPCLSLFDMPFAAPDRDRALAQLDGALGQRFAQDVAANTGLTLLGVWDNGLRHIATAEHPLRAPSDCTGLVLRTLPNDEHQGVFRALGFTPRVIDARDLHAAVVNKEVDAQENPLTNTYNFDLHTALPVITLTGHLMGIALVLFNTDVLASWPHEIRAAVARAVAEANEQQRKLALEADQASARTLTEAGARLIELSATEHAAWRAASEAEVARRRVRLAPDLLALFDTCIRTKGKALA